MCLEPCVPCAGICYGVSVRFPIHGDVVSRSVLNRLTVMPFFTFNAFQFFTVNSRMRNIRRNCKRIKLLSEKGSLETTRHAKGIRLRLANQLVFHSLCSLGKLIGFSKLISEAKPELCCFNHDTNTEHKNRS